MAQDGKYVPFETTRTSVLPATMSETAMTTSPRRARHARCASSHRQAIARRRAAGRPS